MPIVLLPPGERERRLRNATSALLAEVDRHVLAGPSRIYLKALCVASARHANASRYWREQGYTGPLSSIQARFVRYRMPSTKRALVLARLVHVSALLEAPGASFYHVAIELDFATPQCLGRHLRAMVGLTGREYRSQVGVAQALERFRREVLAANWYAFDPFIGLSFEVPFVRPYAEAPARKVAEVAA